MGGAIRASARALCWLRTFSAWLLLALAVDLVALPVPADVDCSSCDAQPLQSAPDGDGDEERMPPHGIHAAILATTPLLLRKGHACRGDDEAVPRSPYLDRLLRPPKVA